MSNSSGITALAWRLADILNFVKKICSVGLFKPSASNVSRLGLLFIHRLRRSPKIGSTWGQRQNYVDLPIQGLTTTMTTANAHHRTGMCAYIYVESM